MSDFRSDNDFTITLATHSRTNFIEKCDDADGYRRITFSKYYISNKLC